MQTTFIPAPDSPEGHIKLRIARFDGKTLIESDQGRLVLKILGISVKESVSLHIKGVCSPETGGRFEIFDSFGRLTVDPIELPFSQVEQNLLNSMIWQVEGE